MRLPVISALCVMSSLAAPAFAADAAANDKPSYCVNANADFYPYEDGQICRKGYQIAGGNCRLKDSRMIAVAKEECARQGGDVALPMPAARLTGDSDPKVPATAKPLTVQNPKP